MLEFLKDAGFQASTLMYPVLVLGIFVFYKIVNTAHKNTKSKINLEDLLLGDDGKMSRVALLTLGSFFLTSWMLMYMTMKGSITEGYFNGYLLAWVAPLLTKIFKTNTQHIDTLPAAPEEPGSGLGDPKEPK